MQQAKYSILSTRAINPQLIARAGQHGISVDVNDFIATRFLRSVVLEKQISLALRQPDLLIVFTSNNAVQATGSLLPATPSTGQGAWDIYCLMSSTLDAVRKYFPESRIKGTAADASALADLILQNDPGRPVIFFCGNKRLETLSARLLAAGIKLQEIVVYETIETPSPAGNHYQGLLFFSPSAVKSFFSINRPAPETICFAIGKTTAAVLKQYTGNRVIESNAPNAGEMIQSVIVYFDNINRHE